MNGKSVLIGTLALAGTAASVLAQSGTTPVVAAYRPRLVADSDTRLSIPVERKAVFVGKIDSVSGSTITFTDDPAWTDDQLQFDASTQPQRYYALFETGTKKGRSFDITGNGSNELTVDLGNDNLSGAASDDIVKVIPHWNLDQLFPSSEGLTPSPSPTTRQTEILVPNSSSAGINLSTEKTYYYFADAWRDLASAGTDAGPAVISPDKHVIVRNNTGSDQTPDIVGYATTASSGIPLRMRAGSEKQDNPVALASPTPISLDDSNLIASGAFRASTGITNRVDEILVFDNSATGTNKSATETYYYFLGAWRKLGSSADVGAETIFEPGTGVIIRKGGNGLASDSVVYWDPEP
ncbi:MAG: TIGR02597 family protein [Verrucomicrobiota bacterium]